ncbi:DUF3054 domain-containing protein [Natronobiforma cellulositropha]|uniref:DUF3054 domain-containing protein n=1 Tax=Natronobiforma cellulositropha TaxID=1679076 RepID=UPI0021D5D83D|nr:DUF3054 domain-containing protein [Natronobiforma cellulositropha]
MDTTPPTLAWRPTADRRTLVVALVDGALLSALVAGGMVSHGTDPLTAPLSTFEGIAPFLLAWVPLAVLAGAYAERVLSEPLEAARVVAVAWLAAANVALLLRGSPFFEGGMAWPFPLVIGGLGLVCLLTWRVGYAAFAPAN